MSSEYHRASEYTTFRVCKCVSICYARACDSACVRYRSGENNCKAYVKKRVYVFTTANKRIL